MQRSRTVAGILVVGLIVAGIGVAFTPVGPTLGGGGDDADPGNGTAPESETEPETGSDPGTDGERVAVEGGELDVDQTALWEWTQETMGRDVDETPTIRIEEFPDGSGPELPTGSFQQLFLTSGDYDSPEPHGYSDPQTSDVHVNSEALPGLRNGSKTHSVDSMLVHEFSHIVQFQEDGYRGTASIQGGVEEYYTSNTILEGGAQFVADEYTDESLLERERTRWNQPNMTVERRAALWPYYRGFAYLEARYDDPEQVWELFESPPESTATILRGDPPGDGPPDRDLSTDVQGQDVADQGRVGAAFTEVVLTRSLDPRRAKTVATGWQWGAFRSFRPPDETADPERHVWLTEWRNETAADAYQSAMTTYLDGRWDASGQTWEIDDGRSVRLARLDDTSLGLVVGPDTFLANATVTVEGDEYAIESADGATATASISSAAPIDSSGPSANAAGDTAAAGA